MKKYVFLISLSAGRKMAKHHRWGKVVEGVA